MEIDKKILKEISEYCKINDLEEELFINQLLKNAFMREKYGERPCVITNTSVLDNYEVKPAVVQAEEITVQNISNKETPSDTVEIIKPKRRSKKIESL